jgi:dihydroxyacetone kinase/dihydroxyacetone kinase-like protein
LNKADVVAMLRAAIDGIKQRGQADIGDKTLLDAFVPAVDSLEQSLNAGDDGATALQKAAIVARAQAEATQELVAKRGRASYSGDRSIGTLDAGAVAVAVLFEQISRAWEQANSPTNQQANKEGVLQ